MNHWPTIKCCLLVAFSLQTTSCLGDQNSASGTPDEAAAASSSASSVPLATRLARARTRAKASAAPGAAGYTETSSQADASLDGFLSEDLWAGRITLPPAEQDLETSAALKRLIQEVRSVKFADRKRSPTFTPPTESQAAAAVSQGRPAGSAMENPASLPVVPVATAAAAPASPTTLPPEAQKTLDVLRQNPTQVRDPLEMAELLFLSGQTREAAPFYAKALEGVSRDDPNYDADRAWILFQLGNCLRESDTAKAQEVYMKLVSEYPASPWTELAKAHGRLLTWYHKDRPEQLTTAPQL